MVVCGVVPVAAIVPVFLLVVHYRGTSAVIFLATIDSTDFAVYSCDHPRDTGAGQPFARKSRVPWLRAGLRQLALRWIVNTIELS